MRMALDDASLAADAIGYVNGHGTATEWGDIAEIAGDPVGVRRRQADPFA